MYTIQRKFDVREHQTLSRKFEFIETGLGIRPPGAQTFSRDAEKQYGMDCDNVFDEESWYQTQHEVGSAWMESLRRYPNARPQPDDGVVRDAASSSPAWVPPELDPPYDLGENAFSLKVPSSPPSKVFNVKPPSIRQLGRPAIGSQLNLVLTRDPRKVPDGLQDGASGSASPSSLRSVDSIWQRPPLMRPSRSQQSTSTPKQNGSRSLQGTSSGSSSRPPSRGSHSDDRTTRLRGRRARTASISMPKQISENHQRVSPLSGKSSGSSMHSLRGSDPLETGSSGQQEQDFDPLHTKDFLDLIGLFEDPEILLEGQELSAISQEVQDGSVSYLQCKSPSQKDEESVGSLVDGRGPEWMRVKQEKSGTLPSGYSSQLSFKSSSGLRSRGMDSGGLRRPGKGPDPDVLRSRILLASYNRVRSTTSEVDKRMSNLSTVVSTPMAVDPGGAFSSTNSDLLQERTQVLKQTSDQIGFNSSRSALAMPREGTEDPTVLHTRSELSNPKDHTMDPTEPLTEFELFASAEGIGNSFSKSSASRSERECSRPGLASSPIDVTAASLSSSIPVKDPQELEKIESRTPLPSDNKDGESTVSSILPPVVTTASGPFAKQIICFISDPPTEPRVVEEMGTGISRELISQDITPKYQQKNTDQNTAGPGPIEDIMPKYPLNIDDQNKTVSNWSGEGVYHEQSSTKQAKDLRENWIDPLRRHIHCEYHDYPRLLQSDASDPLNHPVKTVTDPYSQEIHKKNFAVPILTPRPTSNPIRGRTIYHDHSVSHDTVQRAHQRATVTDPGKGSQLPKKAPKRVSIMVEERQERKAFKRPEGCRVNVDQSREFRKAGIHKRLNLAKERRDISVTARSKTITDGAQRIASRPRARTYLQSYILRSGVPLPIYDGYLQHYYIQRLEEKVAGALGGPEVVDTVITPKFPCRKILSPLILKPKCGSGERPPSDSSPNEPTGSMVPSYRQQLAQSETLKVTGSVHSDNRSLQSEQSFGTPSRELNDVLTPPNESFMSELSNKRVHRFGEQSLADSREPLGELQTQYEELKNYIDTVFRYFVPRAVSSRDPSQSSVLVSSQVNTLSKHLVLDPDQIVPGSRRLDGLHALSTNAVSSEKAPAERGGEKNLINKSEPQSDGNDGRVAMAQNTSVSGETQNLLAEKMLKVEGPGLSSAEVCDPRWKTSISAEFCDHHCTTVNRGTSTSLDLKESQNGVSIMEMPLMLNSMTQTSTSEESQEISSAEKPSLVTTELKEASDQPRRMVGSFMTNNLSTKVKPGWRSSVVITPEKVQSAVRDSVEAPMKVKRNSSTSEGESISSVRTSVTCSSGKSLGAGSEPAITEAFEVCKGRSGSRRRTSLTDLNVASTADCKVSRRNSTGRLAESLASFKRSSITSWFRRPSESPAIIGPSLTSAGTQVSSEDLGPKATVLGGLEPSPQTSVTAYKPDYYQIRNNDATDSLNLASTQVSAATDVKLPAPTFTVIDGSSNGAPRLDLRSPELLDCHPQLNLTCLNTATVAPGLSTLQGVNTGVSLFTHRLKTQIPPEKFPDQIPTIFSRTGIGRRSSLPIFEIDHLVSLLHSDPTRENTGALPVQAPFSLTSVETNNMLASSSGVKKSTTGAACVEVHVPGQNTRSTSLSNSGIGTSSYSMRNFAVKTATPFEVGPAVTSDNGYLDTGPLTAFTPSDPFVNSSIPLSVPPFGYSTTPQSGSEAMTPAVVDSREQSTGDSPAGSICPSDISREGGYVAPTSHASHGAAAPATPTAQIETVQQHPISSDASTTYGPPDEALAGGLKASNGRTKPSARKLRSKPPLFPRSGISSLRTAETTRISGTQSPSRPKRSGQEIEDEVEIHLGDIMRKSFDPQPGDVMIVRDRRQHRYKDNGYVCFYTKQHEKYDWCVGDFILRSGTFLSSNKWKVSSRSKLFQRTHDKQWMLVGLVDNPDLLLPCVVKEQQVDAQALSFSPRRGDFIVRLGTMGSPSQLEDWTFESKINPGDILARLYVGDVGLRCDPKDAVEGQVEIYVYGGRSIAWIFMGSDVCRFKNGYDLLEIEPKK